MTGVIVPIDPSTVTIKVQPAGSAEVVGLADPLGVVARLSDDIPLGPAALTMTFNAQTSGGLDHNRAKQLRAFYSWTRRRSSAGTELFDEARAARRFRHAVGNRPWASETGSGFRAAGRPSFSGQLRGPLADVSGKGMPAALLMSAARGIVRSLAPLANGPGEVLTRVNKMLLDDFRTGRYVTMIYAVLDPARRTLTFASAGHPWPLLCHGTDVLPLHTDAGMPLGLLPCEFTEHTVRLCRDFRLLFYTDGISEALNREDQELGSARLTEFVARHDCSVFQLMQAIRDFRGKCAPKDDATVVLLRSV